MVTSKKLSLKLEGDLKTIAFGVPATKSDFSSMFTLRHKIYSERDYIEPVKFPEKLDIDDYDRKKKCIYVIAKEGRRVLGAARLIRDRVLPTEKYFNFDEPAAIKEIPRNQRGEIGRLVIDRYSSKVYLPRNLVLLLLVDTLLEIGKKNNVKGGYCFVKESLIRKLKKLKFPIHLIVKYKEVYPSDGVLNKYFNQDDDKVIPAYFVTTEIEKYINTVLSEKNGLIQRISDQKMLLNDSLYGRFLKKIGVL